MKIASSPYQHVGVGLGFFHNLYEIKIECKRSDRINVVHNSGGIAIWQNIS